MPMALIAGIGTIQNYPTRSVSQNLMQVLLRKILSFLLNAQVTDVRFGAAQAILQPQEENGDSVEEGRTEKQENQGLVTSLEPPTEPCP